MRSRLPTSIASTIAARDWLMPLHLWYFKKIHASCGLQRSGPLHERRSTRPTKQRHSTSHVRGAEKARAPPPGINTLQFPLPNVKVISHVPRHAPRQVVFVARSPPQEPPRPPVVCVGGWCAGRSVVGTWLVDAQ